LKPPVIEEFNVFDESDMKQKYLEDEDVFSGYVND
jgi:hypothetical protein